eukprot:GHVS01057079.1.p1 GENE.GHVS01057079.1~~GHVS01057079.1.p1  ORF type:complete len:456 (-),score=114.01 GHVS01057079.1:307-1674(-)
MVNSTFTTTTPPPPPYNSSSSSQQLLPQHYSIPQQQPEQYHNSSTTTTTTTGLQQQQQRQQRQKPLSWSATDTHTSTTTTTNNGTIEPTTATPQHQATIYRHDNNAYNNNQHHTSNNDNNSAVVTTIGIPNATVMYNSSAPENNQVVVDRVGGLLVDDDYGVTSSDGISRTLTLVIDDGFEGATTTQPDLQQQIGQEQQQQNNNNTVTTTSTAGSSNAVLMPLQSCLEQLQQKHPAGETCDNNSHCHSCGGCYAIEASTQQQDVVVTTTTTIDPNGKRTTTISNKTTTTGGVVRGYFPSNPYSLPRPIQVLLQFTELPFMILWVYFAYFSVIVVLTAAHVRQLVWLNALVAGILVGIGLNANAYHAIMYRGSIDYGMVVRFFLIPFGVSALSGLTNSLREKFMLVFPKDPAHLTIAIMTPAILVISLLSVRTCALYTRKVPLSMRNLFLNGKVYT